MLYQVDTEIENIFPARPFKPNFDRHEGIIHWNRVNY